MTTTDNFPEIKQEILRRAHEARACKGQYGRACKSETMAELCQVIKDNFWWACNHKVIDCELLEKFKEAFAEHDIFVNVSVERGYLLCGSATVKACGSATVKACGSATVKAWGSATVKAYGSAYCTSYLLIECKLSDNALYRVRSINTVYYANDNIKFQKL